LVVATKIDRMPKARRKPRLQAISDELSLPREAVMAFSATEKLGFDEVWDALLNTLTA
ncbi:MAG TPA: YihA family ribosome biogenesis GTP-binding protein, partial [Archangium sp.]|nr:YihA family ribosome biogenesis GTP-binding protein [Archangium sp.]